jgi:hypothetical protein
MAHTPLKAIYRMGNKPPVGIDKYRCKNRAHWKFRALKKSQARDGVYCWAHLLSRGIYGDDVEYQRLKTWIAKHQEPQI